MENDKESILKKLIQKAGTEETKSDFTSLVMKNIELETELEFVKENKLRVVINDIQLDSAPPLLQRNILSQIAFAEKTAAEPIISRQVWYTLAALAVLILAFCVTSPADPSADNVPYFSNTLTISVFDFFIKINVLPVIYPAVIFALAVLVMGDYFLRAKMENIRS
ncbi:hypothetical protein L0657_24805 [Dyadobacter sp. CY345]|uniref:hypothetical protein n=1 Tax=Dyadobacter sp. CY345 TaxID=2909335 RepID=UPI001F25C9EB|nr:hypothetical protein [Dyadobacter sp. CY345]MCF2447198.1 hypothetical protein [Dyadobacter sp. CY345]